MFEKVKALLVEELQINESDITMDAELTGDLNINSIELANMLLGIRMMKISCFIKITVKIKHY